MNGRVLRICRESELSLQGLVFTLEIEVQQESLRSYHRSPTLLLHLQDAIDNCRQLPVRVGPIRLDSFSDEELAELRQECTEEVASRMLEAAGYA